MPLVVAYLMQTQLFTPDHPQPDAQIGVWSFQSLHNQGLEMQII